jgi:hypothetical protein
LLTNDTQENVRDLHANYEKPDLELGFSKDFLLKAFGEEGVESEFMRLHNLVGHPRFLFTIKEETKVLLPCTTMMNNMESKKRKRSRDS